MITTNDWRLVKLGDISTLVSKGTTPTTLGYKYSSVGIPFLRAEDVYGGAVDVSKVAYHISAETHDLLSRSQLQPNDFLITIAGTIGRVGFVPQNANQLNCNQAVAFVRLTNNVDVNYICYACQETNIIQKLIGQKAGGGVQNLSLEQIRNFEIPLPPLEKQRHIAIRLDERMRHVERARQGIEEQLSLLTNLVNSYFRESLQRKTTKMHLSECMVEVKKGVGETWAQYPVLGATRAGVAPAKEKVGKQPQRYKLVEPGTIFYNPMRIMIGSIAMLDDGDESGITSPDYVVLKGKEGILHPRWFYYWFRSPYGENFIKSLARGAVRERMLFNRLDKGEIELPDWETQVKIAKKLKEIKTFKQALESQLAEINELPSALLRQAFAGQL